MNGPNPYVFAGGCPRSGTTLLQRILDHHPDLAVGNDSNFIPGCVRESAELGDPPLTPDIVARVRAHRRFARLGLPDPSIDRAASASTTYSQFVAHLYDEFARERGKPRAGEKTPAYMRHIPLLHRLFPWARFVHLIRDGRDVALSLLSWATKKGRLRGPARYPLWDEQPVAVAALWWQHRVTEGRANGRALPSNLYLEASYERLIADPRAVLADVLSFLDLPFSEEALDYHKGRTRPREGRSAKAAWLPPTPGLRDWRTQMSPEDQELFEAIAGKTLEELGYERAHPRPSAAVMEAAERYAAWWAVDPPKRRSPEEASRP